MHDIYYSIIDLEINLSLLVDIRNVMLICLYLMIT